MQCAKLPRLKLACKWPQRHREWARKENVVCWGMLRWFPSYCHTPVTKITSRGSQSTRSPRWKCEPAGEALRKLSLWRPSKCVVNEKSRRCSGGFWLPRATIVLPCPFMSCLPGRLLICWPMHIRATLPSPTHPNRLKECSVPKNLHPSLALRHILKILQESYGWLHCVF